MEYPFLFLPECYLTISVSSDREKQYERNFIEKFIEILNTQYSILNTQYSILNTQYSILNTQYSLISNIRFNSIIYNGLYKMLSAICSRSPVQSIAPHLAEDNTMKTIFTDKIKYISDSAESFNFLDKIVMKDKIIANGNEGGIKNVAVYGFSKYQMKLLDYLLIDLGIKFENTALIGTVNRYIELTKETVDFSKKADKNFLIKKLSSLGDELTIKKKYTLDEGLSLNEWLGMIKKNKNKIDVFSYINSKNLTETNKNTLIRTLILKNTSGEINVDYLFKAFDEIKLFDSIDIKDACNCLSKSSLPASDIYAAFKLVQTHFFRNTSKLSLDLFKNSGYAISFAWNKGSIDDKNSNEMILLDDVLHKPFKQGERRYNNLEPITYSEIRHLIKHKTTFNNIVYRISSQNRSLLLSSGIDNNNWFEYQKSPVLTSLSSAAAL